MAFIRIKTVKNIDYLYLVKSKWDPFLKTSTQQTIKYLGKVSDITLESIPHEYRENPRILSAIRSKTKNHSKKILATQELKEQVLYALKNGEVEKILRIVEKYIGETSLAEFYDDILKQVLYKIGDLWEQNELDIATEHICSNITKEIIYKINRSYIKNNKNSDILLCTPDGEIHNIACNIIESILLQKGYRVHNISPSIPTESIIKYIRDTNPSIVMISVTLKDNIGSSKRLIKKINSEFQIPILIGGLAFTEINEKEKKDIELTNTNTKLLTNTTLKTIVYAIGKLTKNFTISSMLLQHKV
jgi:MerR family transcriptional regulator, light-induced transcriptional regulator